MSLRGSFFGLGSGTDRPFTPLTSEGVRSSESAPAGPAGPLRPPARATCVSPAIESPPSCVPLRTQPSPAPAPGPSSGAPGGGGFRTDRSGTSPVGPSSAPPSDGGPGRGAGASGPGPRRFPPARRRRTGRVGSTTSVGDVGSVVGSGRARRVPGRDRPPPVRRRAARAGGPGTFARSGSDDRESRSDGGVRSGNVAPGPDRRGLSNRGLRSGGFGSVGPERRPSGRGRSGRVDGRAARAGRIFPARPGPEGAPVPSSRRPSSIGGGRYPIGGTGADVRRPTGRARRSGPGRRSAMKSAS